MGLSLLARASLAAGGPEALIEKLGAERVQSLLNTWQAVARDEQRVHPTLPITLFLAGRGFGKSFSLSGAIHEWVDSGKYGRIHIVARTAADVRDVVIEGPSGLIAWAPRDREPPRYYSQKKRVTFWNGAQAFVFSAEEPDSLRGPQCHATACDELAAWKYMRECWDQIVMTTRLGNDPRKAIATTPRPLPLIKELVKRTDVHVIRGSTYDNAANLARPFLEELKKRYEGTRLGRQELRAEILDDNPNALWRAQDIEAKRVSADQVPDLIRIVIGVDPAMADPQTVEQHEEMPAETGIVVAGVGQCRCRGGEPELHAFVLEDLSDFYGPVEWARAIGTAYEGHGADRVVPETNQGGSLVTANVRANSGVRNIAVRGVHAKKNKRLRAEPVSGLSEQGKVHHVGTFPKLEDQLTQWDPITWSRSPDRLDAYTYALTDLMLTSEPLEMPTRRPRVFRRR